MLSSRVSSIKKNVARYTLPSSALPPRTFNYGWHHILPTYDRCFNVQFLGSIEFTPLLCVGPFYRTIFATNFSQIQHATLQHHVAHTTDCSGVFLLGAYVFFFCRSSTNRVHRKNTHAHDAWNKNTHTKRTPFPFHKSIQIQSNCFTLRIVLMLPQPNDSDKAPLGTELNDKNYRNCTHPSYSGAAGR